MKARTIFLIIFAFLISGCQKDRFYELAKSVDKTCGNAKECDVVLSDIYLGEWEYAYYFLNSATQKGIESEIGVTLNFSAGELCSYLIFVDAQKIISYDEDCSISNDDNLTHLLSGRQVYPDAIVNVDTEGKDFLKIRRDKSTLHAQNAGKDKEGRKIYFLKVATENQR